MGPRGWMGRRWVRALVPVAFVAAGAALQAWVLTPLGASTTYVALSVAVVLSAVLGGLLSGAVATAVSVPAATFWLSTERLDLGDGLALATFVAGSLAVSVVCEIQRRDGRRLSRAEHLLNETGRTAKVGGWSIDLVANRLEWTDETRRIHEVPEGFVPDVTSAIDFYHPDDRPAISEAVKRAIENAEAFDLELRIVTARGNVRWVRALGHALLEGSTPVTVLGSFQDVTERKAAEAALKRYQVHLEELVEERTAELRVSEERLRLAQEAAGSGAYEWDFRTNEILWSPELEHLYGLPTGGHARPYGKWAELIHPDDRDAANALLRKAAAEGTDFHGEFRIVRPDGETRWMEAFGRTISDESGKPVRMVGLNRDITERKEAELRLSRQEMLLSIAQDAARAGTWRFDAATGQSFWSREMFSLRGIDSGPGEIAYEDVVRMLRPDDRAAAEEAFARTLARQQALRLEYRVIRPDGREIWIRTVGDVLRDAEGRTAGMAGIDFDVTESRKSEAELRRHAELLSMAQHAARAGTWFWEIASGELTWSKELFLLYGLDPEKDPASFESFHRVLHPDDRAESETRVAEAIERQAPYDVEFRVVRPGGDVRWLRSIARASYDEAGRAVSIAGLTLDVTEGRKAEDEVRAARDRLAAANVELAKAARMKDEFLASMSHEMRTPLTAIVGTAEHLRALPEGALSPDARRHVESIGTSGRRLQELVDEILDVARLDAGRVRAESERCLAADVVEAAARKHRAAAAERRQELAVAVEPEGLVLSTDAARLAQLLECLLSNAVKFTPPGGRIEVIASGDDGGGIARISVCDTGIGIAAENVERLFGSFVQLDGRIERVYGGAGLGLALVKRLTDLLGGTIAVESRVGQGTCFTLTLPWTERAVASSPGAPRTPPSGARPTPRPAPEAGLARRIPADLRAALHAAVERADAEEIESLAGRLAERDAEAARLVRELARQYEYESLLRELDPARG